MWHIATNVWELYPILGTGLGDFGLEIAIIQEEGLYVGLVQHLSAHNIFFQALATSGVIGLLALCLALFVAPLRYFYKLNREKLNIVSVCGIVMLIAFAAFGLTESWIMRSPPVALYLMYFVVLVSAAMKLEVTSE
jgi:O-antigen ligase